MAQSRHAQCADECPLLGAKRTLTNRCSAEFETWGPAPRAASRGLVLASRHRVVGPGLGLVRFLRRLTVARAAHMVALMLRLIFTLARFVAVISTLALTMIVSHLVTPLQGPIWA